MTERVCDICGSPLAADSYAHVRYCSHRCAATASNRAQAERRRAITHPHEPLPGDIDAGKVLALYERPRRRADCLPGGPNAPDQLDHDGRPTGRKCPWVGCRYHLLSDRFVSPLSAVRTKAEAIEQMDETCALDIADRGPLTLDEIGEHMGVTRERIRQLEAHAVDAALRAVRRRARNEGADARDIL